MFWPLGSRPAGLTKPASCSWPTVDGSAWPGRTDAHRAVVADGHALRRRRNGDAGLDDVAVVGDQLAGRADLERAVAGVAGGAVGHLDLEQAVAADRDVERVRALLQVALAEVARGGDGTGAEADLQAGRQRRLLAAGGAGLAQVLVHQVLEHRVRTLVAVRRHVGEVVRDGVQLRLLGLHSRLRNPQRSHHGAALRSYARHGGPSPSKPKPEKKGGCPPSRRSGPREPFIDCARPACCFRRMKLNDDRLVGRARPMAATASIERRKVRER